jgi:hypothetical protein
MMRRPAENVGTASLTTAAAETGVGMAHANGRIGPDGRSAALAPVAGPIDVASDAAADQAKGGDPMADDAVLDRARSAAVRGCDRTVRPVRASITVTDPSTSVR